MPVAQADRVYSEAHDDLYQFSFDSRRWFPCSLRRPRGAAAAPAIPPPAQTAAGAEPDAAGQSGVTSLGGGHAGRGDDGPAAASHATPEATAAGTVHRAVKDCLEPQPPDHFRGR